MKTRECASKNPVGASKDDFKSVARRIECDEDKARFGKKLGKIARAQPGARPTKAKRQ